MLRTKLPKIPPRVSPDVWRSIITSSVNVAYVQEPAPCQRDFKRRLLRQLGMVKLLGPLAGLVFSGQSETRLNHGDFPMKPRNHGPFFPWNLWCFKPTLSLKPIQWANEIQRTSIDRNWPHMRLEPTTTYPLGGSESHAIHKKVNNGLQ